jgi:hypothetical protein
MCVRSDSVAYPADNFTPYWSLPLERFYKLGNKTLSRVLDDLVIKQLVTATVG